MEQSHIGTERKHYKEPNAKQNIQRFPRIRGDHISIPLDAVKPSPIRWLWRFRIPRAKVTILDGDPDQGKSLLAVHIAAQLSVGGRLPPDCDIPLGNVIMLNAEDDADDTIVPRLIAAGADTGRISLITTIGKGDRERPFEIPDDLDHLELEILRLRASLVIIDPLMAYLSSKINSWKDQDVRRALAPLTRLAQKTGAAILVIRHLNKLLGRNPLHRGGGSMGIIGAARSGLLLAPDPNDPEIRVLAATKTNLSKRTQPIAFRIATTKIVEVQGRIPRIEWLGVVDITADELLNGGASAGGKAVAFLRKTLEGGVMPAREVRRLAKAEGITKRTLDRAKVKLHVKSKREGGLGDEGRWLWSLPKSGPR